MSNTQRKKSKLTKDQESSKEPLENKINVVMTRTRSKQYSEAPIQELASLKSKAAKGKRKVQEISNSAANEEQKSATEGLSMDAEVNQVANNSGENISRALDQENSRRDAVSDRSLERLGLDILNSLNALMNPLSTTSMFQKKIWSIYYNDTEQKVIIYPGSQVSEILGSIRMIFDFDEKQELLFLNEDGLPTVLSSAIPTETKLYMQKKQSVTDQIIESRVASLEPASIAWHWLEPSNPSHKRKNNNFTVYQSSNQTMSHCFGSLVITTGTHYFTLLVEPVLCCVFAGIEASEKVYEEDLNSEFLNSMPLKTLVGDGPGFGLASKPVYEIGFLVNMNSKELTVTDHREKKVLKKKRFTWEAVRPVAYFKHEVSVTITNMSLPTPSWI